MTFPKLPTKAELQRAEETHVGGGKALLDLHFETIRNILERQNRESEARIANLRHIQRYRYFSVASGCLLALASLFICGYAVNQRVDIAPFAWVLGPLAGLAGVFVWGYRPSESDLPTSKQTTQNQLSTESTNPEESK